uniref:Uncharacterized protein n=1 Tax=Rhizophora mucronata TaxID=61149 RepID=A0A2P2PGQ2_RHIMU
MLCHSGVRTEHFGLIWKHSTCLSFPVRSGLLLKVTQFFEPQLSNFG